MTTRRVCQTCKFFEEAGFAGSGWCHHPNRKTSAEVMVLVRHNELACRNAWGSALWESTSEPVDESENALALPTKPGPMRAITLNAPESWQDRLASQRVLNAQSGLPRPSKTTRVLNGQLEVRVTAMTDSNGASPRLRVFLCHASGDKPAVRELYQRLVGHGVKPWFDEEDLLPGQYWEDEIPKAVRQSDVVIICLSTASVGKTGYVQKEISYALDVALEQPEGAIFLIPARLEECIVPQRLRRFQRADLYAANGFEKLVKSLDLRAATLGVAMKD